MSKTEYAYTTGTVGTAIKTYNYTYGNTWKDQLTAFDGTAITYDAAGNPTSYLGKTLTWSRGRLLTKYVSGSKTVDMQYDGRGMRVAKARKIGTSLITNSTYIYDNIYTYKGGLCMIEFKGKISGKTLKYHSKRYKKLLVFSSFATSLLMFLLLGSIDFARYLIFILAVIALPLLVIICPASIWVILAPHRIYIDLEDRTIVSEIAGSRESFRMIDDVIAVKDHGEFYTFKFNSRRNHYDFIVQKDLITQGTIEEFEEIFKEVLVRVN